MHLSILRLLAVGLAGFDIAVGSPCKPRTSVSESSIATTVITSNLSSFTLSLATSATFPSTTTEAVTPTDTTTESTTEVTTEATTEGTTVTETDTVTATSSNEEATSSDTTSEATTFATSTATTEAISVTGTDTTTETMTASGTVSTSAEITQASTTTEATTTAAPTTTAVPTFRVLAMSGPHANEPILSNRNGMSQLIFSHAQGYTEAYFTLDTATGQLLIDGHLPVCGFFPGDGTSSFSVCNGNRPAQQQFLTCDISASSQLECTVPEMQCSMFTGCAATGDRWGTSYIGASGGTGADAAILGHDSMQGYSPVGFAVAYS
ncbi:hypothetical protein F53441_5343 [Fusarium austroafricanum]|uniref:Uncharacterized protein n=1 Tax=Fusarium austroafricanum TaxID=2364996 RepID=A0A8H4NUF4_9HYPO|nr:hypothetical protein F53441_5343 [Fusarium austroafricanum]